MAGGVAAIVRTQMAAFVNGGGHFGFVADEETGFTVLDNLGEGAGGKRHNRCSTGESFHRDQRTGLGDEAGGEQTLSGGQQTALACNSCGSDEDAAFVQARKNFASEIGFVVGIAIDPASEEQRNVGNFRRAERNVKTFFRTNAAKGHGEMALRMASAESVERHAVGYVRQQLRAGRTAGLLSRRNAVVKRRWTRGRKDGRRIPGSGEMERSEGGLGAGVEIAMKIYSMQVNEVDGPAFERGRDGGGGGFGGGGLNIVIEGSDPGRRGEEGAADFRTFAGNYDRVVAGEGEGGVELRDDLFSAANGIARDGREGVSDVQDR